MDVESHFIQLNSVLLMDLPRLKKLFGENVDGIFSVFKLPVSFDIDQSLLESRYRDLQMSHHPDRLINGSSEEKTQACRISSELNMAYSLLVNPVSRAKYLLEEMNGINEASDISSSEGLLEEVLSWMEEVNRLSKTQGQEYSRFLDVRKRDYEETLNRLGQSFRARNLILAKKELVRLLYLQKVIFS